MFICCIFCGNNDCTVITAPLPSFDADHNHATDSGLLVVGEVGITSHLEHCVLMSCKLTASVFRLLPVFTGMLALLCIANTTYLHVLYK